MQSKSAKLYTLGGVILTIVVVISMALITQLDTFLSEEKPVAATGDNVLICVEVHPSSDVRSLHRPVAVAWRVQSEDVWHPLQLKGIYKTMRSCVPVLEEDFPFDQAIVFEAEIPDGSWLWVTTAYQPEGLARVVFEKGATPPIYVPSRSHREKISEDFRYHIIQRNQN